MGTLGYNQYLPCFNILYYLYSIMYMIVQLLLDILVDLLFGKGSNYG